MFRNTLRRHPSFISAYLHLFISLSNVRRFNLNRFINTYIHWVTLLLPLYGHTFNFWGKENIFSQESHSKCAGGILHPAGGRKIPLTTLLYPSWHGYKRPLFLFPTDFLFFPLQCIGITQTPYFYWIKSSKAGVILDHQQQPAVFSLHSMCVSEAWWELSYQQGKGNVWPAP